MKTCDFNNFCKNNPIISPDLAKKFCNGNYFSCARFKIRSSLGSDYLPNNLHPKDEEKAKELIHHGFMHAWDRLNTYY